jgi:hypothetical protein
MEISKYHLFLFVVFFIQIVFIHFEISTNNNLTLSAKNQTYVMDSSSIHYIDEWIVPFPERIHLG